MKSRNTSVLVVDGDIGVQRTLERLMVLQGFSVHTAGTGEAALELFEAESPDLVLMDVALPDADGNIICRDIRDSSNIPIILVTAKNALGDKIVGLENGADDYISKPFSSGELVALVRAVLRRTKIWNTNSGHVFQSSNVAVDFSCRTVTLNDKIIDLTAIEYEILSYMAQNAGHVLTASMMLQKVWGESYETETHLLHVNIARLRKKLGDNSDRRFILTKPGLGYMIQHEMSPGRGLSSKDQNPHVALKEVTPQAVVQLSMEMPVLLPRTMVFGQLGMQLPAILPSMDVGAAAILRHKRPPGDIASLMLQPRKS